MLLNIFERALAKWGFDAQTDMVCEESAELIVAIKHYKRKRITKSELASECADVEIMSGTMRAILGNHLIDEAKEYKLKRLEGRLNGVPGHIGTAVG